jgi:hypothetical protein
MYMDYGNQVIGGLGQRAVYGAGPMDARTATEVPTPDNSRIRDGVSAAEQALSALHEMISHLEKRLETVLSPMPSQPANVANAGTPTGPPRSHVTGRLSILNEGFGHAIQRLNELGGRIEV